MNAKVWKMSACVLVALAAMSIASCWTLTGPQAVEKYPPAEKSPYRLPWKAGQTHLCVQSNRGIVSHRGWQQYAYDFSMPVGTEICAARAGKVVQVVASNDGHGYHWPNNVIAIRHDDATLAYYLHIKKDGNRVNVGDSVSQGQVIALSGHVGNSMMPHLHFHVTDPERNRTLPLTFSDVSKDCGVPRMFKCYTSENASTETSKR